MARVNVFLSAEVLTAIDAEAAVSRVNRSALIQTALIEFLARRKQERDEAQARREMEEAGRRMDALGEKLGAWDPVKLIREFRNSRAVAVHERRARYRTSARKGRP